MSRSQHGPMFEPTEWDTAKLPKKWQRYIEDREAEIRQLKRRIEELSEPPRLHGDY